MKWRLDASWMQVGLCLGLRFLHSAAFITAHSQSEGRIHLFPRHRDPLGRVTGGKEPIRDPGDYTVSSQSARRVVLFTDLISQLGISLRSTTT
ncbi:hypothetical protein P175DRAFT_0500131 [Aspergillus ochraceoroseus IBT 24754]|uniref:Secreted protein n=1 Tax=Aspergillus ochraceoroseus IBT 24754 TaxID=1392256 RepID=A0A2T5M4T7_9EURO|nr:uncharacterized protein P175DRAFT_0500131 [Aspergillus ochraceoroseus IBT 24754]PTU23558.1 hypothetical protein P175DRAFT_0500131 [Aspergillus ochraceoroseus IBT 24754]